MVFGCRGVRARPGTRSATTHVAGRGNRDGDPDVIPSTSSAPVPGDVGPRGSPSRTVTQDLRIRTDARRTTVPQGSSPGAHAPDSGPRRLAAPARTDRPTASTTTSEIG